MELNREDTINLMEGVLKDKDTVGLPFTNMV